MQIQAVRGIVENGKVRLTEDIVLPENANVFVIMADSPQFQAPQIRTPRLANPRQAEDFRKQIVGIQQQPSCPVILLAEFNKLIAYGNYPHVPKPLV